MKNHIKPLSPRGLEFIGLLADGLTTKEVADKCGITVGTVQNVLLLSYARIGARNMQGAVAWYVRNIELKGGRK